MGHLLPALSRRTFVLPSFLPFSSYIISTEVIWGRNELSAALTLASYHFNPFNQPLRHRFLPRRCLKFEESLKLRWIFLNSDRYVQFYSKRWYFAVCMG